MNSTISKKVLAIFIFLFILSSNVFSQTYYSENFESEDGIPSKWNEYVNLSYDWDTLGGGHSAESGTPNSGHPESAFQGSKNAIFFVQSLELPSTILKLPSTDLEFAINPDLHFYHAQEEWISKHDNLKVYYKKGADSSWVFLEEYANTTVGWVERNIQLPNRALFDTCIIGFKATTNNGHGVCLDSITIVERGTVEKELDTISIHQACTDIVVSESSVNPILRIDFRVTGNTGTVMLDSLILKSLNTNDSNIASNGIKLFLTEDSIFTPENQLGTAENFNSGIAKFKNLNYDIPTGYTFIWVTYDISSDLTHEIHNNIIDAMFNANSIYIDGGSYPSTDISPNGNRHIIESIFYDNFETDKSWTLTGEFERDLPQGLGGQVGNPDPSKAYQGDYVLGVDLTGIMPFPGDYDTSLTNRAFKATTPTINCNYYRDLDLYFYRWLNVDNTDSATIDISADNGSSWHNIWRNDYYERDNSWEHININIPAYVEYSNEVKLRFNIGPTDGGNQYSGWNIDNLSFAGNYISKDVRVSELLSPIDGCGHTSTDSVTIRIENLGGSISPDTIPIICSVDGGTTIVTDTIFCSIPIGGDTIVTLKTTIDLSEAGYYSDFYVTTAANDDEWHDNDTLNVEIYAAPTYSTPYFNDFEINEGFWISSGTNSTWEWGIPTGSTISPQAANNDCWVTNLNGNYNNNEYSFVEGPCFSFVNSDYPVVELRIWGDTEEDLDGAAFQYSIDGGNNWVTVDSLSYPNIPKWEWYNDYEAIPALGSQGWDTISGTWYTVKTFMPKEITNLSSVKLRFLFASNGSNNTYEGFAFDDLNIYEAPKDVGIDSIIWPLSSCSLSDDENISVSIKNYGLDSLNIGDTIMLGYKFQFESGEIETITDTCILAEYVCPDSTYIFEFSNSVNMISVGKYNIHAFSLLDETPEFYNLPESNDTTYNKVYVYGTPDIELGKDIFTVHPDSVVLDAYTDSINSYLWQDSSTDSIFNVIIEGKYSVTVTNDTTGCFSTDSIEIVRLIPDIGFDSLISPVSDCELSNDATLTARFTNFGTDTLFIGDSIQLGYTIGLEETIDTLVLQQRVSIDSSFIYTFKNGPDMSVLDTSYKLKVFSKLQYDSTYTNDTLTKTIISFGYPDFVLEPDTFVEALNFTLNAGDGYEAYLWEDGSTDSTYIVSQSDWYSVTVYDEHSCSTTDSAEVTLWIHDLGVTNLNNPISDCELLEKTPIDITFMNNGTDTLHIQDTVLIGFDINQELINVDTLILESELYPNNTLNYTFIDSINMQSPLLYNFDIYTIWDKDMRSENDTLQTSVEVFGYPEVDLGPDTIVKATSYNLDPGVFDSYIWHDESINQIFTVEESTISADDYYSVTVTDNHGCSNYDSVMVTLNITDLSVIELVAPVSSCEYPDLVDVIISIENNSNYSLNADTKIPLSYSLNGAADVLDTLILSENLQPDNNTNHTFSTKADVHEITTHNFVVSVLFDGDIVAENNTLSENIEVIGTPDVNLGPDTIYANFPHTLDAGDFETYLWQNGDTNRSFTVVEEGTYSVTVTDEYGCEGSDKIVILNIPDGINDFNNIGSLFKIYPNPVHDNLTLELNSEIKIDFTLKIINTQSQTLFIKNFKNINELVKEINVSNYPPGIYYLKIYSDNKSFVRKFAIQ